MSIYYIDRIGPNLHQEVERQLLKDLEHYGISSQGLQIEWWNACGEGHDTKALRGRLEEVSALAVLDKEQNTVAEGWMDFIHGGEDNLVFIFWRFLRICSGDDLRAVKDKPTIPAHIWGRLSEKERYLCAQDRRWRRNPYIREWRR